MKSVIVATQKGGAGKTTLAANIAAEAHRAGLRVVLLDLDPQQSLRAWAAAREGEGPVNLARNPARGEVAGLLAGLGDLFDLCVIDTPPVEWASIADVAALADLLLIPVRPSPVDMRALRDQIGPVARGRLPFAFVLSDASRSKDAEATVRALAAVGRVAPATLSRRVAYSRAMGAGVGAGDLGDAGALAEVSALWEYVGGLLE